MIDGIVPRPPRPQSTTKNQDSTQTGPTFQPPEFMATQDEKDALPAALPQWKQANASQKGTRSGFLALPQLNKKQWLIVTAALVILLGGSAGAFVMLRKKPTPQEPQPAAVVQKVEEPPKPTTVASKLTGLQVKPEINERPVIGAMVENSPDARPQSSLSQAGVVFEAIAEGGITRFLTLWQDNYPDYLGPVRSVRLYYLQWLQGFDAPIAHVGGSAEALNYIKSASIKDLDQFYNTGPYRRVTQRYAPHNMYTDVNKLADLAKSKGWGSSTYAGFVRKGKEEPSAAPTAKSINMTISGVLYNVHYDYDATTNSYKRTVGGKPHIDERTGAALSPKVAIAIVVPYSIQSDGIHSEYKVVGSGKAYIFQDGIVTEGIWEKSDVKSQIRFGDANGAPLGINAGQTWITAVGAASNVSYTP